MVQRLFWSILLLAGLLSSAPMANPRTASAQIANPKNRSIIEDQLTERLLLGQWELTFPILNGTEELTQRFIIAPDGQFFDLSLNNGEILQFSWWIEYHEQTPLLMVNTGNALLGGVFTGPDQMIMRILPLDSTANTMEMQSVTLNARKLSTDITLPPNRTVISGGGH